MTFDLPYSHARGGEPGDEATKLLQSHHSIPACGADLLALEPGSQTCGMEYVLAGQLLAPLDHVLTTDDAHSVGCL